MLFAIANSNADSSINSFFDFYGHTLQVAHDNTLSNLKLYSLNQKEISGHLGFYRNAALKNTTRSLYKHVKHYGLDGAATTILVDKISRRINTRGKNEQTFIKYLILKDLGFDVVLTRTGKVLNCMGNLSFTPGRYIFINYANRVYKDLDFKNRTNRSKHLIYMDSNMTYSTISRNVLRVPRVNAKIKSKKVNFKFNGEMYETTATSNQSVTEFLADLPLFSVGREFTHLNMSNEMEASIVDYLKRKTVYMNEVEATKFLLSFVQQVVPYGSDYVKYGEERFYYPEETIMAKDADCEDKAMLLAYLAKRVLNIQSVGLYFENDEHLSLALEIPDYAPTGSFKYKGKTYVSCEPTAGYPKLGQSQFALKKVTEVIPL